MQITHKAGTSLGFPVQNPGAETSFSGGVSAQTSSGLDSSPPSPALEPIYIFTEETIPEPEVSEAKADASDDTLQEDLDQESFHSTRKSWTTDPSWAPGTESTKTASSRPSETSSNHSTQSSTFYFSSSNPTSTQSTTPSLPIGITSQTLHYLQLLNPRSPREPQRSVLEERSVNNPRPLNFWHCRGKGHVKAGDCPDAPPYLVCGRAEGHFPKNASRTAMTSNPAAERRGSHPQNKPVVEAMDLISLQLQQLLLQMQPAAAPAAGTPSRAANPPSGEGRPPSTSQRG